MLSTPPFPRRRLKVGPSAGSAGRGMRRRARHVISASFQVFNMLQGGASPHPAWGCWEATEELLHGRPAECVGTHVRASVHIYYAALVEW